jgi:hypothetical protein
LQSTSYKDILQSDRIDIFGFLNNQELSIFMQEMHHPEMMHMISSDL